MDTQQDDVGVGEEYSPLMWACYEGDLHQVNELLEKGASVEEKDGSGWAALDHALEIESKDLRFELVCCLLPHMKELKTRNKENDSLLQDVLSRWVAEWVKEIEESWTKRRHRWGGHAERFMLREESYDLAQHIIYQWDEDDENDFHGISPLIYACADGKINLVLNLCSQKGTFFSPDFKDTFFSPDFKDTFERLVEYQEKMEELAFEAQKRDKYFEENPEERRKILFGV